MSSKHYGRTLIQGKGNTAYLGVNKLKREQGIRHDGSYNPKKSSLRGSVVRDLKVEGWDILYEQYHPVTKDSAKKALGK